MTFVFGSSLSTSLLRASPSIKGIRISVIGTSVFVWRIMGKAGPPSPASPANDPYCPQGTVSRRVSRMMLSSSNKNTRSKTGHPPYGPRRLF